MSDDDLIRRGDALAAVQLGDTVTKMQARIRAIPYVDADPVCTDCGGTGITYQTERRCACQPAIPARGVGVVCTWPSCGHTAKGQCQPSTRVIAPTDAATQKGGDAHDRRLRSHEASPGVTAGADAAQAREAALMEAHKAILAMDTKKDEDLTYNLAVLRAAEKVRRLISETRT